MLVVDDDDDWTFINGKLHLHPLWVQNAIKQSSTLLLSHHHSSKTFVAHCPLTSKPALNVWSNWPQQSNQHLVNRITDDPLCFFLLFWLTLPSTRPTQFISMFIICKWVSQNTIPRNYLVPCKWFKHFLFDQSTCRHCQPNVWIGRQMIKGENVNLNFVFLM